MNNSASSAIPAGARVDVPRANPRDVAVAPPRTLKTLKTALRDFRAAQCANADAAFIERVNARADAAYRLPVTTLAEADAMLRLVVTSDGDGLDLPVLDALKGVSTFLKSAAA